MTNGNTQQPVVPKPPARVVEQVGLRVSLIPDEEEKVKDPRVGFKKFVLIIIIGALLMAAVVVVLMISVKTAQTEIVKIDAATGEVGQGSQTLADQLKDAKATQTRLAALSVILAGHRSGLRVFEFFEKHTLSDVAFSSISIGDNSVVNLSAAAGSFESYAAQINELRAQTEVKSLVSSGLNPIYETDGRLQQVDFALSVTFNPEIFVNLPAGK